MKYGIQGSEAVWFRETVVFRRDISSPGFKSKTSKNPTEAGMKLSSASFLLDLLIVSGDVGDVVFFFSISYLL
jgi:hypothetical protein